MTFAFFICFLNMLKLAVASESNPWYHWTGQQLSPPTSWICKLLSFPVVTHFGNIATCPWSPPFSSSFLAALLPQDGLTATHGCLIVTECDISMLPLKLLAVKVGSCWAPFPPPALWFRHYTMFFLSSLLAADSTATHILDKLAILCLTLFTRTVCPCASFTWLSSQYTTRQLHLSPHSCFFLLASPVSLLLAQQLHAH